MAVSPGHARGWFRSRRGDWEFDAAVIADAGCRRAAGVSGQVHTRCADEAGLFDHRVWSPRPRGGAPPRPPPAPGGERRLAPGAATRRPGSGEGADGNGRRRSEAHGGRRWTGGSGRGRGSGEKIAVGDSAGQEVGEAAVTEKLLVVSEEAGELLSQRGRTTVYGRTARCDLRSVRVDDHDECQGRHLRSSLNFPSHLSTDEAAQPSMRMRSGRSCISALTRDQTHCPIGTPMQSGSRRDREEHQQP